MKNKFLLIIAFCISLLFVGCYDDCTKVVVIMPDPVQLVSSSPANGATDIAAGDLTIVLTYDQYVFCPSAAKEVIQIPGATVQAASSKANQLTVQVSGLEKGKQYQLTVPVGAIWGPAQVEVNEVVLSFTTVQDTPMTTQLVTPNALASAQKVFNYMSEIYGKKSLSGTMSNVAWNIEGAEKVYSLTGKYPAMTHVDYIHIWASPANWIDYSDISFMENWWNAGGIVGASWHWMVPKYEGAPATDVTYQPNETTFTVNNALTEGTWENGLMKADLAKLASYLKLLQEKGIPVVWRPLHEASGNIYEYNGGTAWFWWGRDGAEAYKKLWIYMFDYFNEQGLNNLIWVWTSQVKDPEFYPGDKYVDIIARDIYGKNATESLSDYQALLKQYGNKMIALGENGCDGGAGKSLDNFTAIWDAGSKWLYFMPWYDDESATIKHASDDWWIDAIGNPNVITRDQLPSFK